MSQLKKNSLTEARIKAIKRKNSIAVTKYLALSMENAHKKKCMITFTPNKPRYSSLIAIRNTFLKKVVSILKRKKFTGYIFKYFAKVEIGKYIRKPNPHLHIQCFFDVIEPLREAYEYTIEKHQLDTSRCSLNIAQNHKNRFNYVIKEYIAKNFNLAREETQDAVYKGKPMYSCSRKEMPDYLIRRLYIELKQLSGWKNTDDKYSFILNLINKRRLFVKKTENTCMSGYKRIKNWLYYIR